LDTFIHDVVSFCSHKLHDDPLAIKTPPMENPKESIYTSNDCSKYGYFNKGDDASFEFRVERNILSTYSSNDIDHSSSTN
jgi:hypothetical protein